MIIPIAGRALRSAPNLNKPCASFNQPPREQTSPAKVFGNRIIQTISFMR